MKNVDLQEVILKVDAQTIEYEFKAELFLVLCIDGAFGF
jgi:hypothetical protein